MTQQHGRRYEHSLAAELTEATTDDVWLSTVGYSGNSAIGSSDIVVAVNPQAQIRGQNGLYLLEAKKRQAETGKRCSSVFGGSENDETGVEELLRFIRETPDWATPVIVISFDHRAPIVLDARLLATWLVTSGETDAKTFSEVKDLRPSEDERQLLEALTPWTTPSDNISMVKPETDRLDSAQASPPEGEVIADVLRLPRNVDPFGDVGTDGVAADD